MQRWDSENLISTLCSCPCDFEQVHKEGEVFNKNQTFDSPLQKEDFLFHFTEIQFTFNNKTKAPFSVLT